MGECRTLYSNIFCVASLFEAFVLSSGVWSLCVLIYLCTLYTICWSGPTMRGFSSCGSVHGLVHTTIVLSI